jgi:DNA-binding XRE family transcriptional regulator
MNSMQKDSKTVYKAARLTTDFTQETAAELLHVSVESVRAYERGATTPSDDIVILMIDLYATPWLAIQHLTSTSKVAARFLPHIELRDLPSSVLMLQKEISDTGRVSGEMVEVTCDGAIERQEQPKWQIVTKELQELAGAALAVLFAPIQKEKTAHMRAVR